MKSSMHVVNQKSFIKKLVIYGRLFIPMGTEELNDVQYGKNLETSSTSLRKLTELKKLYVIQYKGKVCYKYHHLASWSLYDYIASLKYSGVLALLHHYRREAPELNLNDAFVFFI